MGKNELEKRPHAHEHLCGVRIPYAKFRQYPLKNVAMHKKTQKQRKEGAETQTDSALYTRLIITISADELMKFTTCFSPNITVLLQSTEQATTNVNILAMIGKTFPMTYTVSTQCELIKHFAIATKLNNILHVHCLHH